MNRRRFAEECLSIAGIWSAGSISAGAQESSRLPGNYSKWDGLTPLGAPGLGGDRWGVPELWWYGRAQGFSYGAEVEIRAEDATSFWMKGRAQSPNQKGLFGVAVRWGRPLAAGYAYKFVLRMTPPDCLPDLITIDDCIVWRRAAGYTNASVFEVECEYVPASDGTATLRLLRECGSEWVILHPPHQRFWSPRNLICQRAAYNGPRPAYERMTVPEGARDYRIDAHVACTPLHDSLYQPAQYDRPVLPELPYPGAEVKIIERTISPIEGGGYARLAGLDILTYQPGSVFARRDPGFEAWAKAAASTGVRDMLVCPVLLLRECGHPEAEADQRRFLHWHSLMRSSSPDMPSMAKWSPAERKNRIAQCVKETSGLIKRWLELVPGGRVLMFEVEVNGAYGNYRGGIADAEMGVLPGYEGTAAGGPAAWRLTFQFFQELRQQFAAELGSHADRFRILANLDRAAFQGAYCYHSGVDIVLHKNIHRQSVNIVVANSRGAANAYGKEYGYDFDAWDRNYWGSYSLREIEHGLLVYFHSGAGYLMDEIAVWSRDSKCLTGYGAMWLDFCRYAKTHPRLGSQHVRIAIMRAMGDEWNRVAGPSAGWEAGEWLPRTEISRALREPATPPRWAKAKLAQQQGRTIQTQDTYLWDYHLLNQVFADFGSPWRTNANRLYTGTPYGPVNFIPWDTPAEKLKQYQAIIFLGNGWVDRQTASNLEQFVEGGGTLLIAAGQLRGADGGLVTAEFGGVQLGGMRELQGLPYTYLSPTGSASVYQRLSNGDPMLIRASAGAGTLFIFSGEYLTYWNDSLPVHTLQQELAHAKLLDFAPASDWLEYSVRRKRRTWIFTLFNHGRGYSPSGNGRDFGQWRGKVSLDPGALELNPEDRVAVYRVSYDRQAAVPFSLLRMPSEVNGRRLSFSAAVEEVDEIVIGPEADAQNAFFA